MEQKQASLEKIYSMVKKLELQFEDLNAKLIDDEGELTDEARLALKEARETPEEEYVSL